MERISGISNTSRSNNNSKGNQNYSSNAGKAKGMSKIDALAYKEELEKAIKAISEAKDENKFKSLIEKAEKKLTSQVTTAPVREDSYRSKITEMMANSGLAAKARMETKPIEELTTTTTTKKRTVSSYATSYGEYRRDLSYVTPSYKSFESTSKDSRGYKNNYSDNTKPRKSNDFNGIESNTSLEKATEKVSFWNKFKNAIKNFFKTEEKKQEPVAATTVSPKVDKAAQYRSGVQKAAPQINQELIEKRSKQTLREMAIRDR